MLSVVGGRNQELVNCYHVRVAGRVWVCDRTREYLSIFVRLGVTGVNGCQIVDLLVSREVEGY